MDAELHRAKMDRDWEAVRAGAPLAVYGSFRHVVNLRYEVDGARDAAPAGDRYYRAASDAVCRDVHVWIGDRSCPFGPGALILECDALPDALRAAETVSFTVEAPGVWRLSLARGSGQPLDSLVLKLPAGTTPRKDRCAVEGALALDGLEACADRARLLLDAFGNRDSPFVGSGSLKGPWGSLADGGDLLCRLLARQPYDACSLKRAFSGIVGLGPGLTPSADDFIVGALAVVCSLFGPRSQELAALRGVVQGVADRTTSVSRLYLLSAAYGRFSNIVSDALRELRLVAPRGGTDFGGSRSLAPPAIAALLGHGSTSGTDTLAGIACMLRHASRASV